MDKTKLFFVNYLKKRYRKERRRESILWKMSEPLITCICALTDAEIIPHGYRISPVVQNDAGGYDLRGIAGPFFREDNPAGSSGGSFIMHSHL